MNKKAKEQAKDTGLALLLLILVIDYLYDLNLTLYSIMFLIFVVLFPGIFIPLSRLWFRFSDFFGKIMTKVILLFIFIFIITPISVILRISGKDFLQIRAWKRGDNSVFKTINHKFVPEDLRNPY